MRFDDVNIKTLLGQIAAKTPAPGGGAVAPLVMGLGAALGQMVVRFSEGKKSLAAHSELHNDALAALERWTTCALDLAEADATAYSRLNALWKEQRDSPEQKAEWASAVAAAIDAPMRAMNECREMLDLCERLVGCTNRTLDSDLAIAAVLAEAAIRAAAWNVRINLPLLDVQSESAGVEAELNDAIAAAHDRVASIEAQLLRR